jgi:uncharacterized protein (DUF58 family)
MSLKMRLPESTARTHAFGFVRQAAGPLDWGKLAPLRFRARALADGMYAGAHKSARRGAGIEFGGFREYVSGDDLRWLDRRSLLLRDKPLLRQFETETDRTLRLVVDATASMAYCGPEAQGAKYAYAALLAAALARVAIGGSDPVGVSYLGGKRSPTSRVPVSSGREAFERIIASLEHTLPEGDSIRLPTLLQDGIDELGRSARRGNVVVVLTDALDVRVEIAERIGCLATRGIVVLVVQLLDPDEATFPFEGSVLFRALEGQVHVESDAETKPHYLAALKQLQDSWRTTLLGYGARWVTATTDEAPLDVARRIVAAVR